MSDTLNARCFCGAVHVKVTGEPKAMGYCHCESCRHWSAGPVNAFSLWSLDQVKVVKGEAHLKSYNSSEISHRKWCDQCGGHVMTVHPGLGLADVFAALLPDLKFKPTVHLNYAETVLPIKDGLPKLKDFPAEFGGSGEMLPE